ncbi:MAG: hypothetical protein EOO99_06495 [Pedobacter sp.]|nr:MAG: hypothetical protein EOO99_06495 [Pedobacter sp.]
MNNKVAQALHAGLNQFGKINNLDATALSAELKALFESDLAFLAKADQFDAAFDNHPKFEELREVYFDLLMVNFFSSDVNKLEADYLDSPEWLKIEEDTIERGTELLNLLLYINECHDENIKPSLEDFLKEFLLVEEDEFQDEFHIYEDLITHQGLTDTNVETICRQAQSLDMNAEMEELFVPFMTFFYQTASSDKVLQELEKHSDNAGFDVGVYTIISTFNQTN